MLIWKLKLTEMASNICYCRSKYPKPVLWGVKRHFVKGDLELHYKKKKSKTRFLCWMFLEPLYTDRHYESLREFPKLN